MLKYLSLILFIPTLFLSTAHSATPGFNDLSKEDLDAISEEFSANFVHRAVSPASTLGDVFGFEIGLVGGIAKTPQIEEISLRENPDDEPIDKLIHAGLLGAISLPKGITGELVILPEQEFDDISISNLSMGLKWTFSEVISIPVVDLAVKGHFSSSEMTYDDTVDGAETTVTLDNSTKGIQLLGSKKIFIVEPFIGLGYISRDTDLQASGTAQIFNQTFTANQSGSADGSSSQFLVGAQLDLGFLHMAAQYENVFSTDVISGKLSLAF